MRLPMDANLHLDALNSLTSLTRIDVLLTGDWRITRHGRRTWRGENVAGASIFGILFLGFNCPKFLGKSNLLSQQIEGMFDLHPTTRGGRTGQFLFLKRRSFNTSFYSNATLP